MKQKRVLMNVFSIFTVTNFNMCGVLFILQVLVLWSSNLKRGYFISVIVNLKKKPKIRAKIACFDFKFENFMIEIIKKSPGNPHFF